MSGPELEAYRERGEEFRHRLTCDTLRYLSLPPYWGTDCEFRGEWGGIWPVHVRLTHPGAPRVVVEITSPGSAYPCWQLRLCSPEGQCQVVCAVEMFMPGALRDWLGHIDRWVRAGFTGPAEIMAAMRLTGQL